MYPKVWHQWEKCFSISLSLTSLTFSYWILVFRHGQTAYPPTLLFLALILKYVLQETGQHPLLSVFFWHLQFYTSSSIFFPESHFFVFIIILNHKRLYFIDFCHAGKSNNFFGLGFLALGPLKGLTILFCKTKLSVRCVAETDNKRSLHFLKKCIYITVVKRALQEDLTVNTKQGL